MKILSHERQTRFFTELNDHIESRISELQRKNEKKTLSDVETADIRGAIAELRHTSKLLNPKPAMPVKEIISPYD